MKKYLMAVMPAVCKDKTRPALYNKIAVYQKGPYVACCASDGHRLHFAYLGGDLEYWHGTEPTHLLDAKKVRKSLDCSLEDITANCSIDISDTDEGPWGNGVWQITSFRISQPGSVTERIVNQKYMSDAFKSAIFSGPQDQVMLACGGCLDMVRVYTSNYLAIVMPTRR